MASTKNNDEKQVAELLGELGRMLGGGRKDEALLVVGDLVSSLLRERQRQSDHIRELLKKIYGSSSERIDPRQLVPRQNDSAPPRLILRLLAALLLTHLASQAPSSRLASRQIICAI